jgi:hypothetical protein
VRSDVDFSLEAHKEYDDGDEKTGNVREDQETRTRRVRMMSKERKEDDATVTIIKES